MLRGHIRSSLPLAVVGLHLLGCGGGNASSPENSRSTGGNVATGGTGGTGASTGGTSGGTGGLNPGTGGVTIGGTGGIAMTGGTGGGTPQPGAPVVAQLTTNVPSITEGQSVTFNALVTDPDGAADILGGTLKDASGTSTYGTFVQQAAGSFTLTLDWAAISAVVPIQFVGQDVRTFRAQFSDQGTHMGEASTMLALTCGTMGAACVPGACTDLATDVSNCGACDAPCRVGGTCNGGMCAPSMAPCFNPIDGYANCEQFCASIAETCIALGCNGATVRYYGGDSSCTSGFADSASSTCTTDLTSAAPGLQCCCSDTPQ